MATKKKTARRKAPKKGTIIKTHGRPKGAKDYVPRGLECRVATPLARSNAVDPKPGLKRLVLETLDENYAVNLERLKVLINKKDKALFKLLEPKKVAKKKTAKS